MCFPMSKPCLVRSIIFGYGGFHTHLITFKNTFELILCNHP